MRLKLNSVWYSLLLLALQGCVSLPSETRYPYFRANCGYGPEDLVLDTVAAKFRILISCDARRKTEVKKAGIYTYDPATHETHELPRTNEPAGMVFHPHGIDAVLVGKQEQLLVISHNDAAKKNSIIRYEVRENELYFLEEITHPLFNSPNAVAGLADGSFLVSNDLGTRGSTSEMLFKQKKATIVYWCRDSVTIAAEKIAFGNGITIKGNTVYHASTTGNYVCSYQFKNGKLTDQKILAHVKGPDNIRLDGGDLIVACHPKFMAFINHMKDSSKISPSLIYRISPSGGEPQIVYFNNGEAISACATGLVYRKKLFLSQVFNPWILDVDLP
ncbi:MAG: SMP-30/gluconolactonase/LRE family protein [Chitinophagales bacterium]